MCQIANIAQIVILWRKGTKLKLAVLQYLGTTIHKPRSHNDNGCSASDSSSLLNTPKLLFKDYHPLLFIQMASFMEQSAFLKLLLRNPLYSGLSVNCFLTHVK